VNWPNGLDRTSCQATLPFPTAAPATEKIIKWLRALAASSNVDVVEFPRPR
jgi:hypothetical protein